MLGGVFLRTPEKANHFYNPMEPMLSHYPAFHLLLSLPLPTFSVLT